MFIQDLVELRVRKARMEAAKKTAKHVAIGLGVGVALGAVAGVLLAPKSGKETREDIATGTKDVIEQVKDQVEDAGLQLKREFNATDVARDAKAVTKKVEAKADEVKTKIKKEVAGKKPTVLEKKVA